MNIKPIKTIQDYENALQTLERIFDADPNTPEGDTLEILSLLIKDYEDKHFPIDDPDPIEAIKFRMDQMNIQSKDLGKILGATSRASEILHRKRHLNLNMIRSISKYMNIPAKVLIKDY